MINDNFHEPSFFEYLDVIGLKFNFKVDGKEQYRTKFGAFLTIFYVFFSIGLFFGFGVDLYQRKNPKVSYNNKIIPHEDIYLSNHNFTLAFRVEDYLAKMVINESIFHHELTYYKFVLKENGEWENVLGQLLPVYRCQDLNNTKITEEFYNISLASWYCVDFNNLTMGGNWDGNFVYGLLINTKQCQFSKNSKCLKEQELKSIFQNEITGSNFYYSLMYLEALPDMDDFDRPIKQYFNYKFESLSLKVQKRRLQYFKRVIIKNDKGWFFNDLEEKEYLSSDTIVSDFNFKDELNEDVVYSHYIYFANKVDIYNRSYIKIQEVIANIGGFSKILYAILTYIYLLFGKYLKNIYLIKRIEFDIKDELGILKYDNEIKLKEWQNFKRQSSGRNYNKSNKNNKKMTILKKDMITDTIGYLKDEQKNVLNTNLKIDSNNIINSNSELKKNKNLYNDFKSFSRMIKENKLTDLKNNLQEIHPRKLTDQLKINPLVEMQTKKRSSLGISYENKLNSSSKILVESGNMKVLNKDLKAENNLNKIQFQNKNRNEKSFNLELVKNNTIFIKSKNTLNFLNEKNKISTLGMIFSNCSKKHKNSIRSNFRYHYYRFFNDYLNKSLNIFTYYQNCNELENIKEILFEDYSKQFSYIKPAIELNEFGINLECFHNKTTSTISNKIKIDRIISNMFNKLQLKLV